MTADAVGGVWTYCVSLANELKALGVEIELAVMGPEPTASQRAEAEGIQVFHRPFRLEWMEDPWQDVDDAADWLLALERNRKPDLIHLNGYSHGAVPFRAPVVAVAHSCVSSWWRAVHQQPAPTSWNVYRNHVQSGLAAAHKTVAISNAMRDALVTEYGHDVDAVIYNGIGSWETHADSAKFPAVFCAGRFWDEAKNLRILTVAAPDIHAEVFAAGDGWESGGVWGLGKLDRETMNRWYSRCSVFCHPALYEPFGLAPLEAARFGCALVLADIPSLREIWGDSAIFADARNPHAIAEALNLLLLDELLCKQYAAAAQMRSMRYTAERQACAYRNLYSKVV